MLERVSDIQIVAEASDGDEALHLIVQYQPDVVLMDISMPKLDGFEVTRRVTTDFPNLRVIMLSVHSDEEYVLRALSSGATGYLSKNVSSEELELAIKAVANGKTYLNLPPTILEMLRTGGDRSLAQLTPRQREVLQLIAQGVSTKGIALALNVSAKTVESHRAQLMERLGIYQTAGLVRYAIKAGLIRMDD